MILEIGLIAVVALAASALTFVSGFGLGTLLMPAFALFLPIEVAIAATALVHLANGLLKAALMGRFADRGVLVRFGLVALVLAAAGAWVQESLATAQPLAQWSVRGTDFEVSAIKLVVGLVMAGFALAELHPRFESLEFDRRWLPLGGAISGFFGGLSGHQGALRSAFLARCGLTKEAFIGTGELISILIDVARLGIYLPERLAAFRSAEAAGTHLWELVGVGCAAAFVGTLVGQRVVKKVTLKAVRMVVGVMLLVLAALLIAGIL